jgi:glutaredoxin
MSSDATKITLFVVPHCPLCTAVRQWLDGHAVDYVQRDVAADWGALRVMYEGTRQRLVPVVQIADKFIVRPSREELARMLS